MATTLPTGGMIDPTKQAEYPVLLGDRLAAGSSDAGSASRLINLNYNYKTKSTSAQQRSTLARSSQSRELYNLTITDKPPNAENTLTYVYEGSTDPARETGDADGLGQEYALMFDADRKAYILEPVTAQLNFNLRSAPAKTEKQLMEQYEQLRTLQLEDSNHHNYQSASGDDQAAADGSMDDDDGPADDSNPYDFRHFLPKEEDDPGKSDAETAAPETQKPSTSVPPPPAAASAAAASAPSKPAPKMKARPKTQTDPLRQKKTEPKKQPPPAEPARPAKPAPAKRAPEPEPEPEPEPQPSVEDKEDEPEELEFEPQATDPKSSPSDTGMAALSSHKAAPSPGSNIIIDGDLIIDMGSPPPTRRTFNINPAHFSSNNTPNGEEEDDGGRDDDMTDTFRLPSPAGNEAEASGEQEHEEGITPGAPDQDDEVEDDDALAAEMEAAFEESAREEPAATQSYQQRQYNAPSDDESEVSEEE